MVKKKLFALPVVVLNFQKFILPLGLAVEAIDLKVPLHEDVLPALLAPVVPVVNLSYLAAKFKEL